MQNLWLEIILRGTNSYVVLTEKGINGINNAKKRTGDSRTIFTEERAHISCGARYANSKTIEQDLKRKKSNSDEGQPSPKKLRSSSSFEFKTCSLHFCQTITEREFRDCKAFQVMSKNGEFDKNVLEVCDKREDALAILVKGSESPLIYMLLMQSFILPAIHLLEQIKFCLKSTVKTRILHHQA